MVKIRAKDGTVLTIGHCNHSADFFGVVGARLRYRFGRCALGTVQPFQPPLQLAGVLESHRYD